MPVLRNDEHAGLTGAYGRDPLGLKELTGSVAVDLHLRGVGRGNRDFWCL